MAFLAALPAITSVAGATTAVAGAAGSIFGGGKKGGAQAAPIDYYQQYGAQAAAASSPLTAAMQGLGVLQGSLGGALGLEGSTLSSAQLSVLKEAINQAQTQTAGQASEVLGLVGAGIDLQKTLGQAKVGTELLAPQFAQQAGSAALAGENQLANLTATTNYGLKNLQETTRAQVAAKQAATLADVFSSRAKTEGLLALGAQSLSSNLQLEQARTLSSLAKTRGNTASQIALKEYGKTSALAGQRYFS